VRHLLPKTGRKDVAKVLDEISDFMKELQAPVSTFGGIQGLTSSKLLRFLGELKENGLPRRESLQKLVLEGPPQVKKEKQ
jgi:hypothetical protein